MKYRWYDDSKSRISSRVRGESKAWSYDVWIGVCVTVYVGAEVGKSDAVWILFDFLRYQLDPAGSSYQYARPGCLYTS